MMFNSCRPAVSLIAAAFTLLQIGLLAGGVAFALQAVREARPPARREQHAPPREAGVDQATAAEGLP